MRNFWLITSLALAGCATSETRTAWRYPGLDQPAAERQFQIDDAECRALAMQAVPTPQAPPSSASSPAAPAYRVSGTVMSSNGFMSFYDGTATPKQSEQGGFAPSFAKEYASGRYIRDMRSADRERGQFAQACMLKRGWE